MGNIICLFVFNNKRKEKYIAWVVCTYMSVLSKDNGLAWAIVPPIMALTFDKIDKKHAGKNLSSVLQ